ncbi:hypothetical protein JTB14_013206 [Gonioctena quinquepunctata]|nr:hypothetical protein JTB14_013206 [Gonioctena quinquepunctata]
MKEIEYACELINEVDYENVRTGIEQQIIGGYVSQYQKEHELKKAEEENPMDTGTNQLTNVSEKDKREAGPSKSKEEISKTPKIQPEMKMDRELPRQRNTHKYGHMSEGFAALMEATHKLNYLESDIRREAQKWTKKTTEELEMEHIKKKDFIPYATIAQAIHDATYKY